MSKKLGRPTKPPSERYKTAARQLGRVSDKEWETMKAAAEKRGETFTAWAVRVLLSAARRELKR